MNEVEVRFEPSGMDGLVAVGSYLAAAGRRLGLRSFECMSGESHGCHVGIIEGSDLLSEMSEAERKLLDDSDAVVDNAHTRLACFTRLEKPGSVVVMTKETEKSKEEETGDTIAADDFKKKFEELPLEKKFANLVQLESIAFNETISFILNSPYSVADKFMDVLAEFGMAKHEAERRSARLDEVVEEETDLPKEETARDANGNGASHT